MSGEPEPGQEPGTATFIARNTDGTDLDSVDQRLGTRTLTPSGSLSAIGSYTSENGSLQRMRMMLFAISALVIGAFFTVWTVQRSGEIAILKAPGASTSYLLKDARAGAGPPGHRHARRGRPGSRCRGCPHQRRRRGRPVRARPDHAAAPCRVMVLLGLLGTAASLRTVTSVDPLTALGSAR